MFSRTTPPYDGSGPDHDPLPLRLATAVVVLGLIATGVAVIWRDMAGQGGELAPLAASHGELRQSAASGVTGPAGTGQASADAAVREPCGRGRDSGRSRSPAAQRGGRAPCRRVSYQGVQLTAWSGPGASWTSVVNVWHQRGHQTLIQTASLPGAARPRYQGSIADPDGDGEWRCRPARSQRASSTMTLADGGVAGRELPGGGGGPRPGGRPVPRGNSCSGTTTAGWPPGSGSTPRPNCRCAGRRTTAAPGWSARTCS